MADKYKHNARKGKGRKTCHKFKRQKAVNLLYKSLYLSNSSFFASLVYFFLNPVNMHSLAISKVAGFYLR